MTSIKELLMKEVEHATEDVLRELLNYARFLNSKAVHEPREMALLSQGTLEKDWVCAEEDAAWQDR